MACSLKLIKNTCKTEIILLKQAMGTRRNFRRGEGKPKKAPTIEKKVAERPPHGEQGPPHNEKDVAKRPPYGEKVAKNP